MDFHLGILEEGFMTISFYQIPYLEISIFVIKNSIYITIALIYFEKVFNLWVMLFQII
jgi:hypothetical protein